MPAPDRKQRSGPAEEGGAALPRPQEMARLALDRTDMAEDRTTLATERTFAGWFRTGFASVGIGLGFHALFFKMQPGWVPRAIATVFLLLGIILFVSAERQACAILRKLRAHHVLKFRNSRLRAITALSCAAVAAMIAAIWLIPLRPA